MPVVFLVLFAAIEFTYIHLVRNTATDAAYVGACRGIAPNATTEDVRRGTASILRAVGIRDASITVTPDLLLADSEQVTVTVEIPLDSNTLISRSYLNGRTISRSCTLQKDRIESAHQYGKT